MRHLSALNNLYNVQDVILLMVIIENRFQEMQNQTRKTNPRKIISASKTKENNQNVFLLFLLTIAMFKFWKTFSGGFSCVHTRLSFDTELLMPNLIEKDFNKINIDQSFKGCVHYICASLFLSLNECTCQTREYVFYLTLKALFVLKKIKF